MEKSKKGLRLQGKVAPRTLKQVIGNNGGQNDNSVWCFVGYAAGNYKLNSVFNIQISRGEGAGQAENAKMKLIRITDEFGRNFTGIPQGYKTICKFQFEESLPSIIKKLPVLSAWGASPKGVDIYFDDKEPGKRAIKETKMVKAPSLQLTDGLDKTRVEILLRLPAQTLHKATAIKDDKKQWIFILRETTPFQKMTAKFTKELTIFMKKAEKSEDKLLREIAL